MTEERLKDLLTEFKRWRYITAPLPDDIERHTQVKNEIIAHMRELLYRAGIEPRGMIATFIVELADK